ncbi:MAG: DUF362 domain-containing protein [Candidatus Cloacimonetes bacterium]|nr:DUF362 domain-containing protein [Candidatus Cloacimonadota bacterium]
MKIYLESIPTYNIAQLYDFFRRTLADIGFWEKTATCNSILIKPNLLGPYEPEKAVTTHPLVLEALIILLKEHNREIWLGDSPGGSLPVKYTFDKTGIRALAEKHRIQLLNFSQGEVTSHKSGQHTFTTSGYFWQADAVINVAKYKTHSLMYYTGVIKNLYGIIPGLKKSDYHRDFADYRAFTTVLSELYRLTREKITLNIIDGIWGMEGEGPSAGRRRDFGIIMAAEKASALDWVAARMMGFRESQLHYISQALEMDGIRPADLSLPAAWQGYRFPNVKHKQISLFIKLISVSPSFLKKIFARLYRYYPEIGPDCRKCYVCAKSCPVQAIRLDPISEKLVIDQKLCIKCMCCHELCPYQAVSIKKSLLARFLIK